MSRASFRMAATLLCTFLAACGGGGGSPTTANSAGTTSTISPTTQGSSTSAAGTTGGNTGGTIGGGAGGSAGDSSSPGSLPPASPFVAAATIAPADGATLNGTVVLEVRGSSIENAELLPPTGYSPRLAAFAVAADKTSARGDFDSRTLPNGTLLARISAFNRPSGDSSASEMVAMPTRTWYLRNDPEPVVAQIPPPSYMPEVWISFVNLPYVDPTPLNEMTVMDDPSFANMLANEWPRVEGILRRYIPAHVVLTFPTPLGFYGPWSSCLDSHGPAACREAMRYLSGSMSSKRPA
jgi:hypothetical protein